MKLPPGEFLKTSLMISQLWLRQWLGAVRQHAITWTNVGPGQCRHMVSSGLIELNAILCFCFLPYMAMQHTRWILILSTQKCYDFYKLKFFASLSSLYNFFSKHDGLKTAALKFSCNDWNVFSLQCAYLKSITSEIFFTFDNVVTK